MAPNSPACSLIQASMAGARSTAPLNRSNSVLIVATLESAGVFSHGVLRGTCWFQGATLSSYSMGSPKPSVWTPSWRRASKAINRRCALKVTIWAKTPPNVKVSAGSHRSSTNVSSQAERPDVTKNAMQFGIGLFEPLQHRLRGALRFGRAVPIHIGSGQRGGPDLFREDNVF